MEEQINWLEQINSFETVIAHARHKFVKSGITCDYLFNRSAMLKKMADEESEAELSVPSLKGLLFFLFMLKEFDKPQITLNDDGLLQTCWQKSRDNALTVSFQNHATASYVIFRPSCHPNKRTILNRTMNVFDLLDYMDGLQVQIYKATEIDLEG